MIPTYTQVQLPTRYNTVVKNVLSVQVRTGQVWYDGLTNSDAVTIWLGIAGGREIYIMECRTTTRVMYALWLIRFSVFPLVVMLTVASRYRDNTLLMENVSKRTYNVQVVFV